jgi:hypothetical protein
MPGGDFEMKIEIYGEAKPTEKVLRLKLKQYAAGRRVYLQAMDKHGEILAHLLSIEPDGLLILFEGISKGLGLKLNDKGRLEISK